MRVRPYEVEKGSADKLYQMWDTIVRETIEHHGFSDTAKKKIGKHYLPYQTLLKEIVKSFDALPLRDIPRKVRVASSARSSSSTIPTRTTTWSTSSNRRIARPWSPASWSS